MAKAVLNTYLIALLIAFLASIGAVAYVNFKVDSEGVFRTSSPPYTAFVDEIINAKHGLTIKDGDIRWVKLAMIRKLTAGCYVNGSSRQMELSIGIWPAAREYGCTDLLNIAVYYGAYEDVVIQIAALLDNPHFETLFLAMDPWIFRKKKTRRFEVMAAEHLVARKKLGLPDDKGYLPTKKASALMYAEAINLSYFVHNLRLLISGEADAPELTGSPVANQLPDGPAKSEVFFSDGSRRRGLGSYEKLVTRGRYFDAGNIKPPFVSEDVVEEFRTIMKHVQAANKKIAFVLNPYSPEVWECKGDPKNDIYINNARTCEGLREVEAKIRELAWEFGIDIFGSFNPKVAGVTSDDFLDGYHMRDDSLQKIRLTTGASVSKAN